MIRRLPLLLLAAVLTLLPASRASAVTNGAPDANGHLYVGVVLAFYGDQVGYSCSGSLLSPTVFLTAGHCTAGPFGAPTSVRVWFQGVPGYWPPLATLGVLGTPETYPGFAWAPANRPNQGDVGVIVLDHGVNLDAYGTLAPVGQLDSLATERGRQETRFNVVGYGLQGANPVKPQWDGSRWQGTVSLVNMRNALTGGSAVQVTGDSGLGTGQGGACFGDSGGPLLLDGTDIIVGDLSGVISPTCGGATSLYFRTDTAPVRTWITSFVGG